MMTDASDGRPDHAEDFAGLPEAVRLELLRLREENARLATVVQQALAERHRRKKAWRTSAPSSAR